MVSLEREDSGEEVLIARAEDGREVPFGWVIAAGRKLSTPNVQSEAEDDDETWNQLADEN